MFPKKLEQFLENLPLGTALKRIATVLLWILAVLVVFAGLYYIIDMMMTLSDARHPAAVLGTLLAALIICIGTCLLTVVLLHRLRLLGQEPVQTYPTTSLAAFLSRLVGEILAIFHATTGLSTGIILWFGGYPRLPYFRSLMWKILNFAAFPPFISGLFAILASIFQAGLVLLGCYLVAELLLLIRDIPLKTRR